MTTLFRSKQATVGDFSALLPLMYHRGAQPLSHQIHQVAFTGRAVAEGLGSFSPKPMAVAD